MSVKKKITLIACLLSVIAVFSGCENIKFIEKVSETEQSSETEASISTSDTSKTDDWKNQTLETSSVSLPPVSPESIVTTVPEETTDNTEKTYLHTDESTKKTTTSVSETDVDDSYFVEIHPKNIEFTKTTNLYKSSTDTEPFRIKAGFTAILTGRSIDGKWDVIDFSGNTFLAMADKDYYEIIVETEPTTESTTTTVETTLPPETTTTESTTTTSVTTTTPVSTTTTPTTTKPITTMSATTTPTTVTTTTPPPVTTTTVPTTTRPPVTTTTAAPTTTNKKNVTGNVGGIEFPSDTTKTSIVFGLTFVNMDIQIYLVNDVDVSSGPSVPNGRNGYIDLGMLEAGTEMKCLGMSYDGWLRVRLPNGKIGFIYETDASAL